MRQCTREDVDTDDIHLPAIRHVDTKRPVNFMVQMMLRYYLKILNQRKSDGLHSFFCVELKRRLKIENAKANRKVLQVQMEVTSCMNFTADEPGFCPSPSISQY